MRRFRAWLIGLTLLLCFSFAVPEAQGRFWVLVNGALRFTGIVQVIGTLTVGPSGSPATVGGTLCTNVTSASTTGTIEEILMTCTLQGGALPTNLRGVEIHTFGSSAANGNAKVARVYFGATLVSATGAFTTSASGWTVDATVLRTAATTQLANGFGNALGSGYNLLSNSTPAETLSGAVAITVKGLTVTAAADLTALGMIVKAI